MRGAVGELLGDMADTVNTVRGLGGSRNDAGGCGSEGGGGWTASCSGSAIPCPSRVRGGRNQRQPADGDCWGELPAAAAATRCGAAGYGSEGGGGCTCLRNGHIPRHLGTRLSRPQPARRPARPLADLLRSLRKPRTLNAKGSLKPTTPRSWRPTSRASCPTRPPLRSLRSQTPPPRSKQDLNHHPSPNPRSWRPTSRPPCPTRPPLRPPQISDATPKI